jgi:hypothetical protein
MKIFFKLACNKVEASVSFLQGLGPVGLIWGYTNCYKVEAELLIRRLTCFSSLKIQFRYGEKYRMTGNAVAFFFSVISNIHELQMWTHITAQYLGLLCEDAEWGFNSCPSKRKYLQVSLNMQVLTGSKWDLMFHITFSL